MLFAKLTENKKKSKSKSSSNICSKYRKIEDRLSNYYCKRCGKEFPGSSALSYISPNEELGEDVILIEKGEYRCRKCSNLIALFTK
jgi:DNA-directed RNA polymerase subunit RPC12/RpoP